MWICIHSTNGPTLDGHPSPYHSSSVAWLGEGFMSEKERVGITPKSWTGQRHHGVLHLGKRWYVLSADIDDTGTARGVRLDGPYDDHATAEAQVEQLHIEPFPSED
jgi:hypothetical protein